MAITIQAICHLPFKQCLSGSKKSCASGGNAATELGQEQRQKYPEACLAPGRHLLEAAVHEAQV